MGEILTEKVQKDHYLLNMVATVREQRLTVSDVEEEMDRNGEGSQPISVTGSQKMPG